MRLSPRSDPLVRLSRAILCRLLSTRKQSTPYTKTAAERAAPTSRHPGIVKTVDAIEFPAKGSEYFLLYVLLNMAALTKQYVKDINLMKRKLTLFASNAMGTLWVSVCVCLCVDFGRWGYSRTQCDASQLWQHNLIYSMIPIFWGFTPHISNVCGRTRALQESILAIFQTAAFINQVFLWFGPIPVLFLSLFFFIR